MIEAFYGLPSYLRIPAILVLALVGHFVTRGVRRLAERIVDPSRTPGTLGAELFARRHPKIATAASLASSAVTFAIYFLALGVVLREVGISLTAYLATASIVGLAVAFGSQGLVQDVVIGLTLVFSDIFDIGDVVEVAGQIGRVEEVGLRFTRLVNFMGQSVYIPNRSITSVGRFRGNCIRAYVDIQVPREADEGRVAAAARRAAGAMREQFRAAMVTDPEVFGVQAAGPDGWRYARVRFRLWPGQASLVETVYRQRMLAEMRAIDPAYADWMVSVTLRVA